MSRGTVPECDLSLGAVVHATVLRGLADFLSNVTLPVVVVVHEVESLKPANIYVLLGHRIEILNCQAMYVNFSTCRLGSACPCFCN